MTIAICRQKSNVISTYVVLHQYNQSALVVKYKMCANAVLQFCNIIRILVMYCNM